MKRVVSLFMIATLNLSGCTHYQKVNDTIAHQKSSTEFSSFKFKAGIIHNKKNSTQSTIIDSGLYKTVVEFDLDGYMQKRMNDTFADITVVEQDAPTNKYDVLLYPSRELTIDDEKIRCLISLKIVDNSSKRILLDESLTYDDHYERSSWAGLFFSSLLWPPVLGMPIYIANASGRAVRNGVALERLMKTTTDLMIREISNSSSMISFNGQKNFPAQHGKPLAILKQEEVVSDIDILPTATSRPQKHRYAVVIGIENYRQNLQNADYAVRDARKMAEYLVKVLGYPEENVVVLLNEQAAKSDFEKYLGQWLINNVEKGGTVFVYYSGHGAPNSKNGESFLVPYDGDPTFIEQTGYSLKRLYETLDGLPAKNKIVCLDSCFSGQGGRSVMAKGARPAIFPTETSRQIAKDMVVITSSSGTQISSSYAEKGHGLFTYFLLRGIKEALEENRNAKVKVGDLYNYLKPQVEKVARKTNNIDQSPNLQIADDALRKLELR